MAYITAHLMGGLGNQLFQIAAAYAYAKQGGRTLVFLRSWPTRGDRPPAWDIYLDPSQWTLVDAYEPTLRVSERGFAFAPLPNIDVSISHLELYGYFQSSKYFSLYTNEVRTMLQISRTLLALYPVPNYSGAHVRRGDYMKHEAFHHVCSREYYTGARDYINPETPVYWITDDPEWVIQTLYRDGDTVASSDAIADFTRLSQFQNLILSNSSFSWWAAWLNPLGHTDRKICCPNKWFGPAGPQDYESIYEEGWTKIDTTSGKAVEHV